MNEQQKKQIEYVVGIDLGHGETSAAFCPIQWDTPVERLDPVKDMEMGSNKKVLPSAIAILDNGEAYIGDVRQTGTPIIEVMKQTATTINKRDYAEMTTGKTPALVGYNWAKWMPSRYCTSLELL